MSDAGGLLDERYRLLQRIGRGGMGDVYRAQDTRLARIVAIKRIRIGAAFGTTAEEQRRRFQREAQVTAGLNVPGVPKVFDAVTDGPSDTLFIVMEYVAGATLARTTGGRQVPVAWACTVAAQLCAIMAHAHACLVVHRDLKPSNIMVPPSGLVQILDFGIAKPLETDHTDLTATGHALGTPGYMAPEQYRGPIIGPRSDLYALGCILYELLVGQPPFTGVPAWVLSQHCYDAPIPAKVLRPDIPADLDALISELLAKLPRQRPSSAAAVYERLLAHVPHTPSVPITAPGLPGLLYPVATQALTGTQGSGDAAEQTFTEEAAAEAAAEDVGMRRRLLHARRLIALGDESGALNDLQVLVKDVVSGRTPTGAIAVEVRLQIGLLQWSAGDFSAAIRELKALYDDIDGHPGVDPRDVERTQRALNQLRRRLSESRS